MNTSVPVCIANAKPFRLIIRDPSDAWECSLDQINSNSYNHIKLHRASKFFDAEIAKPFPLCIAYDGSFILPAIKEYSSIEFAVAEFNRIFASILLGGVYIEGIEPRDLSEGYMTSFGYFRHTRTFGGNGVLHQALGNKDAGSGERINLIDPPIILASEIQCAYLHGAKILKSIKNLSPSLLIASFTNHIHKKNKEALIHAWISIEQTLDHIWHALIVNESSGAHIDKRRKFLESQQWTAAHKSELLYQKQFLPEETYRKFSAIRTERNNFIHKGAEPSTQITKSALSVLVDLLECACNFSKTTFNREHLDRYLKTENRANNNREVGKAQDIDWSKVQYWKEIPTIPGDENWDGDFEIFEDITLQPIKRKTSKQSNKSPLCKK